ncbi:MAG: family 10 glycosylhydrolase [Bacteroidota bacterium]
MKYFILFFCLLLTVVTTAQSNPPKREFRGAWIATVGNIDWPNSSYTKDAAAQKRTLVEMLDNLKAAGVNAVMFQIRTECDALYNSKYDPWSYWVSGTQGAPPSPYYDPLQFAIEEAHKRGMELHAWLNPYRAKYSGSSYEVSPKHITNTHPEWILTFGKTKILDPGLPMVREYVTNVIMDVARRYDVDGIHFDDYFYVSDITNEDAATYKNYSRGFTNLANWRRDNVNILISQISDSLKALKPYVKFGISPSGMWRAGYPAGICGMYSYSELFADGIAWMQRKSIDYINPQIYWSIGSSISCGSTDYARIMKWWADSAAANHRHLYVGHADYRISAWSSSSELPNQIRLNRANIKCQGSVHYNSGSLLGNPKGIVDTLKKDLYRYIALTPVMDWKETTPPGVPQNFRFSRLANSARTSLVWDAPVKTDAKDTAARYVIYRFSSSAVSEADLANPANIYDITGSMNYVPLKQGTGNYFVITALDRNSNESLMSQTVEVSAAAAPVPSSPSNNAADQRDTVTLKWNYAPGASFYRLQVSADASFGTFVVNSGLLTDTSYVLTGLTGQKTYYWRVTAENIAGVSPYSAVSSFKTGFPVTPALSTPQNKTSNVVINPDFKWNKNPGTDAYRFQISYSMTITPSTVLVDSTGIKDTAITLPQFLTVNKNHFWRVAALNQFGQSAWSELFAFKTGTATGVDGEQQVITVFQLNQNYPNPFNPATVIKYSLPAAGNVTLKVYDILGKEVAVLVNEVQNAGSHSVKFSAGDMNLTSGIYLYRLSSGSFSETRKMVLLK